MSRPSCTAPRTGPYTALLTRLITLTTLVTVLALLVPVFPTGVAWAADAPAGEDCAVVPVNAYGSAPTATETVDTCKEFTAPATGPYDVFGVVPSDSRRVRLAVYDTAGTVVCATEGECRLAADSTYRVATGDSTLILDRSSTQGCVAADPGALKGTIAAGGGIDCLTLSLPEGAHVEALTPRGSSTTAEVVDGTGTRICEAGALAATTCELTGPAPHRVLVSTGSSYAPAGPYHLALYRTDVPNDCPVVPVGDFTASTAKAAVLGAADEFAHCFTIPADDKPRREYVRTEAGDGEWVSSGPSHGFPSRYSWAEHSVLDAKGVRVCVTACVLAPGTAYTVLVRTELSDDFNVVRRDLTGAAPGCAVQPATAVGGPAPEAALGISGSAGCRLVTTEDAGDVVYLGLRGDYGAGATAIDEAGRTTSCADGCNVTGSTRYAVVVFAPLHNPSRTYRLDAMRIATPAGPAPECVRVLNLRDGYRRSGTLDEERTAVCAVLPTVTGDDFWTRVRDPEGTATTAVPSLWDTGLKNTCGNTVRGYHCAIGAGAAPGVPSPTILMLGMPEFGSSAPYQAEVTCDTDRIPKRVCGGVPVSVSSVSPASAPRGSLATLTVHGTSLSIRDSVVLTKDRKTLTATNVARAPDGRSLTVTVGLSAVALGDWKVEVHTGGRLSTTPTFTFTVTPPTSGLGSYVPLGPTRLMDTRYGTGDVPRAKVGPGGTVTVQVTNRKEIPFKGVSAVVLNVTATGPTAAGFVSVHPHGTARTSASNLNFKAGQTISNLVVVPVVDGAVTFYNKAGSVDLIADVAGYYVTDGTGATYKPVTPARLMDTRAGLGVPKARLGSREWVTLKVAGTGGLPATGVTAVVLNVTATAPTAAGFVSVRPGGSGDSSTSSVNFTAGQTIPNLVVVPVSDTGEVRFYNHNGSVDLIADVAGYYTMDATGSAYRPMTPTRLMDTRAGLGVAKAKVGAGATVTLDVAGKGGIPAVGVTAVVLNVTAVAPSAAGFVSVFPGGTVRTSASNLNFTAGTTIPNLVVVPVVNGKVSFYNHAGSVDLLADVAGYYVS
ncbi:hypothetical protein [Streptomyces sp. NPDC094032]|uniref:hypothetical protein n=1 Tax=Streptomyces sp. NPDC094032 TaxID=3155308 RepID=UPI00332324B6